MCEIPPPGPHIEILQQYSTRILMQVFCVCFALFLISLSNTLAFKYKSVHFEEHILRDSAPAKDNLYMQGKILKLQQVKSSKNAYLVG